MYIYKLIYICIYIYIYIYISTHLYVHTHIHMGWLRLVGSIKLKDFFAEYRLFYRALLQKRPIISSILLSVATPYSASDTSCVSTYKKSVHMYTLIYIYICICTHLYVYIFIYTYIRTYSHTFMYIYKYIYTPTSAFQIVKRVYLHTYSYISVHVRTPL